MNDANGETAHPSMPDRAEQAAAQAQSRLRPPEGFGRFRGEVRVRPAIPPWRFSLRSLFVAMMPVACLLAIAVNRPVGVFTLFVASPFLFAAAMAILTKRAPILVGLIKVMIGIAFFILVSWALLYAVFGEA